MSDFLAMMESRRSCRDFKPDPVPEELLAKVLRAGTCAPTGRNRQSPVMIVITDPVMRNRFSRWNAAILGRSGDPFYGAPVLIAVLADRSIPTYLYDGSLVMANLLLAAHTCGLGGCWIHRAKEEFDSPEGKALLQTWGIRGDYEGIGHCALGYAAQMPPPLPPRKADYVFRIGPGQ